MKKTNNNEMRDTAVLKLLSQCAAACASASLAIILTLMQMNNWGSTFVFLAVGVSSFGLFANVTVFIFAQLVLLNNAFKQGKALDFWLYSTVFPLAFFLVFVAPLVSIGLILYSINAGLFVIVFAAFWCAFLIMHLMSRKL